MAQKEDVVNGTTADPEYALRNMLQRYEVVMLDDLSTGLPDFSWAQLFLAIDRLSRKNLTHSVVWARIIRFSQ